MGFAARPASLDDAAAIVLLFNACDEAYERAPVQFGESEIRNWLERAVASTLITEDDGRVIGFGTARRRGNLLSSECVVAPGRGLVAFLLEWAEERAAAAGADLAGRRQRDLAPGGRGEAPPPDGRRVVRRPLGACASDLRGVAARRRPGARPQLHRARGKRAARRSGVPRRGLRMGEIGFLGVLPARRRRGLGRALLLHGFGALYDGGRQSIALDVDGGSEMGALQLYESAGMRIAGQQDLYERRM